MRKVSAVIAIILAAVLLLGDVQAVYAADGTSYAYDGYTYDFWGDPLESPAAFRLMRTMEGDDFLKIKIQGLNDVSTSSDGRIFLTDTLSSRVYVMDSDGNCITALKAMKNAENKIELDADGNQIVLTNPEGTWVHEKERELYIADTGAMRIMVLDLDTYRLKKIISEPENLSGSTKFKPSKVAVDDANRIFVIVQSSYDGIVELDYNGNFIGYYGVNVPEVNLVEYFWKSIASDEQKEQMAKSFAPAFNNITVDGEGFVMAVTNDLAAEDMVFRLNAKGENVLREKGNVFVIGDIWSLNDEVGSQFIDIAVTDYGVYALLDKLDGRIFLYNFDGELMNVFGIKSKTDDGFKEPSGIAWLGDKLVVTDSAYKCAYIFEPTEFGKAMLTSADYYYNGDWDEALVEFKKAIELNANYEIAYTGIGKNYLMKGLYEDAMYYFKLGNNREYYSKAYNGYRGEQIRENFGIVATVVLAAVAILIYTEIRYHRKNSRKAGN